MKTPRAKWRVAFAMAFTPKRERLFCGILILTEGVLTGWSMTILIGLVPVN